MLDFGSDVAECGLNNPQSNAERNREAFIMQRVARALPPVLRISTGRNFYPQRHTCYHRDIPATRCAPLLSLSINVVATAVTSLEAVDLHTSQHLTIVPGKPRLLLAS
jgi:hypothetical protein